MRLKMISRNHRIAIGEARPVINVRRSVRTPWQCVLAAKVQRITLIMIEQKKAWRRRCARTDQSADDAAEAKSELVGVGEIDLRPVLDTRRTQRQLPAADSRALYIDGEKHV